MQASKLIKSAALLFRGFTFATSDEWFYLDSIKKYKRKNNIGMSDKDIFSLLPFDSKFDKLFGDVISMSYALDKHPELLPEQYYSLLTRDGEQFILPLRSGLEQSLDGVMALLREKGGVSVRKASNSVRWPPSIPATPPSSSPGPRGLPEPALPSSWIRPFP